jgi:putative membrane protein insertion efficiency factor
MGSSPLSAPASGAVRPVTTPPRPAAGPSAEAAPPALTSGLRSRHRARRVVLLLVLIALLSLDLTRPPAAQVSARLLLAGIHLYQATLSRRMPALGVQCRFTPTCSHYAAGAITRYGALSGTLRAAWRVARCGPWTPRGTYDPP